MHHRYEFQYHKIKCAENVIFLVYHNCEGSDLNSQPASCRKRSSFFFFFFQLFFWRGWVYSYLDGQKPCSSIFLPGVLSLCHPKAHMDKSRGRLARSVPYLWSKQLLPFYPGVGLVFGFLGYLSLSLCPWLSSLPQSPSAVSQTQKTELKHSAGSGTFPELFSFHASFISSTFLHLILFKSHPFFKAPKFLPDPLTWRDFSFLNS